MSGENKEKNPLVIVANPVVGGAIIIGTAYHQYEMANDPEYRKSIEQLNEAITEGTYKATAIVVDGVQKGWQIVTGDGQNYTFDKEAFDKLPENQKNIFYQNIPKIEEFVNGCSWEPVDESTYGEDNTKEELDDLQKQGGFVLDNPSIPDIGEDTSKEDYEESSKQEGIPLEDNSGVEIFTATDWEKVNKEIENGTFVDRETEQEYDIYVKNKIKAGKEPRTREGWVKARDTWNTNCLQGEAFENEKFEEFKQRTNEAQKQITIVVEDELGNKIKTRLDAIGLDKETGEVVIEEYKSSETAPLTDNQKKAFPLINSNGGKVVGEGKGIFTDGYEIKKGTKVYESRKKEVKDE